MKRLALVLVAMLVLAACGGSGDAGETTTTTSAIDAGGSTSTTGALTPDDTTTSSTSAPTAGGSGGGADCLVGTWEMDSDRFFEAIMASMTPEELAGGTFRHVGGTYRAIIGADGSFTDQRNAWSFDVESPEGVMNMQVTHERTGTYEVGDGTVKVSLPGDVPADVVMSINGEVLVLPPGVPQQSPPAFEYDTAPFECSGDSLTIASEEGVTAYWTRVG